MKNRKLTNAIFFKLNLLGIHCNKIPTQRISTGTDKSIVYFEPYVNNENTCLFCLSSFGLYQGIEYADPEYMIEINKKDGTAKAYAFMNTFRYLESFDKDGKLNKEAEEELCTMLSDWLSELIAQVHSFTSKSLDMAI